MADPQSGGRPGPPGSAGFPGDCCGPPAGVSEVTQGPCSFIRLASGHLIPPADISSSYLDCSSDLVRQFSARPCLISKGHSRPQGGGGPCSPGSSWSAPSGNCLRASVPLGWPAVSGVQNLGMCTDTQMASPGEQCALKKLGNLIQVAFLGLM